jgi:hypothetical protein
MKRLFCVKDSKGKIIPKQLEGAGIAEFTSCKKEAKAFRDKLGGTNGGYYVSRGPDHMGKHGHRVARMRLQPKRVAV